MDVADSPGIVFSAGDVWCVERIYYMQSIYTKAHRKKNERDGSFKEKCESGSDVPSASLVQKKKTKFDLLLNYQDCNNIQNSTATTSRRKLDWTFHLVSGGHHYRWKPYFSPLGCISLFCVRFRKPSFPKKWPAFHWSAGKNPQCFQLSEQVRPAGVRGQRHSLYWHCAAFKDTSPSLSHPVSAGKKKL